MNSELFKSTIVEIYEQTDRFKFSKIPKLKTDLTYNTQPFFADINGDLLYGLLFLSDFYRIEMIYNDRSTS